jgi:hypothetical protein
MSQRTRPSGAQPRPTRPSPPSTRPPKLQSSTRPPSSAARANETSHEVYVQIANLQMARARQQRIRRALQGQVDRCTREIESIDARMRELYRRAGLEPVDPDDQPARNDADEDDGFEYQY